MTVTRREFLLATAAITSTSALPFRAARADAPKYTRYNVTSDQGKKMLASYAKGIQAMLKLPPTDPRNWFRVAFTHFMDCPHGNWWFFVWHRGYLGFVEETVRSLSGDPSFAFPYWDWTALPEIPADMFRGVLTPTDAAYAPFTKDLATFTSFIKPALQAYWNQLTPEQRKQQADRGYPSFDVLWDGVTGEDPKTHTVDPGNESFAVTQGARYLTVDNPKLSRSVARACSAEVVRAGLQPTDYYNEDVTLSFTSSKATTHNAMPGKFTVLEGQPHNLVHNFIGGSPPLDPGPYGNMTNFLSPVDPIFFLHHSNMDRLWAVWTRKQQALGLPILPRGADLQALSNDPFRFFVRADGTFVLNGKAGDFLDTERFGYTYDQLASPGAELSQGLRLALPVQATIKRGVASITLPAGAGGASTRSVVATVTVARPTARSSPRQFDVLVNAPPDVTTVDHDSPYYGGTVAFFGPPMPGMTHEATFAVPLSSRVRTLAAPDALEGPLRLQLRLVPQQKAKSQTVPAIKAASARRL